MASLKMIYYRRRYRDISFFIELKHGFISSRTGAVDQDVKNKWDEAIIQLDVINQTADIHSQYGKG